MSNHISASYNFMYIYVNVKKSCNKMHLPETGQNPEAKELILPLSSKIPEADEWLELCMADEE